jgi:hypothetical protein
MKLTPKMLNDFRRDYINRPFSHSAAVEAAPTNLLAPLPEPECPDAPTPTLRAAAELHTELATLADLGRMPGWPKLR